MPTINIKELDKTTAVESAVDTNVVYVPGFSAKVVEELLEHKKKTSSGTEITIPDAIIFSNSGESVEVGKPVPYGATNQRAYNIADKLVWECTSGVQTKAESAPVILPMDKKTGVITVKYEEITPRTEEEAPDNWNDILPYLYTKTDDGQYVSADTYKANTTYYLRTVASYTYNQKLSIDKGFYQTQGETTYPMWGTRDIKGVIIKQANTEDTPTLAGLEVVSGTIAALATSEKSNDVNLNTEEKFVNLYSGSINFKDDGTNDPHSITLAGTILPVKKGGDIENNTYFVTASSTGSTLSYSYNGNVWEQLDETEYDIPSFNEAVEFTATTKEQDFVESFGGTPYIFPEAQAYPVNGANQFSQKAYSSNNNVIVEKGAPDKSYIYARELLNAGLSVVYEAVVELADKKDDEVGNSLMGYPAGAKLVKKPDVNYLYRRFTGGDDEDDISIFKSLTDRGTYNIKFITSGGYPTFEYGIGNVASTAMNEAAVARGDVAIFIDSTDYPNRTLSPTKNSGSVFDVVNNSSDYNLLPLTGPTSDKGGAYAAMVPVWVKYTAPTYGQMVSMPGSFAYLISYANSVKTYADWLAIAGVARGIIPNCQGINSFHVLTNSIAEAYQAKTGISINPITYIRGYGYALWGNRTLLNNNGLTASSFLNLRSLVCDVKKTVYAACRRYMFEQNNDVLWVSFKSAIAPTLEKMVAGYGIESYKIVKLPTREKAKIVAEIILTPIYAVEDFEVTIVLTDSELTVE